MNNKLMFLIIGGLIILVIILIVLTSIFPRKTSTDSTNVVEITPNNLPVTSPTLVSLRSTVPSYKNITQAPTLNPKKGEGIDIDSPYIANSIAEIKKLKTKLPYTIDFTSSKSVPVSIVIPSYDLLDNEWTLVVNISGIDYQVPESDPSYSDMQLSFLEASRDVFFWLKEQGVDTEKIIIEWGDRQYIKERSEQWLRGS